MATFTPKTEETLQAEKEKRDAERLLPKGGYDFEVLEGSDKPSKSGNAMITLKIKVFGPEHEVTIFDYLIFTEDFEWKVRHAADACGILEKYESGVLYASDFEGRTGRCILRIQPPKDDFASKNVVDSYVKRSIGAAQKPVSGAATLPEDGIPF